MRIALIYNIEAGAGISLADLRKECLAAGHEIVQEIKHDAGFEEAVWDQVQLLVVAGGDGTVGRTIRALAGRGTPLAILPLGTANNIAAALGLDGTLGQLLLQLHSGRRVRFDLGTVRRDQGEQLFSEGVGLGLVPHVISAMTARPRPRARPDPASRMKQALLTVEDTLMRQTTEPGAIVIDGQRVEGEFLLVEVLNIRSVGSRLDLAPQADPTDGILDVVVATEEHRPALVQYLEGRLEGRHNPIGLPHWSGRHIEIGGVGPTHIDDKICDASPVERLSIDVWPGAVELLV